MPNYVKDKVIIVTGAASGFGHLVSEKAAGLGGKLVCADINAEQLDAVTANIVCAGGVGQGVVTDVTELDQMLDQMNALARRATQRFGRIDVLVNNAGIMPLAFYADSCAGDRSVKPLHRHHRLCDQPALGCIDR